MTDSPDPAARLVFEPTVRVLVRPMLNWPAVEAFVADCGHPYWQPGCHPVAQVLTEVAARTCYNSFAKGRPHADHIRNLIEQGHFSTFEHCSWTLGITGVSRSLTHELVRHRHLSYSQESQRFVDMANCRFVVPPAEIANVRAWLAERAAGVDQGDYSGAAWAGYGWYSGCLFGLDAYVRAAARHEAAGLPRKQAREAARSVLPHACETRIVVSGNARAWREVLQKRLAPGADAEFRRLAAVIRALLAAEAPLLFEGV